MVGLRGPAALMGTLLLVVGCTAEVDPAPEPSSPTAPAPSPSTPEPSPTPTADPTPSPTPDESPTVPPLTDLEIRTGGVGPLEVGEPPEGNAGAALIAYDDDACVEVAGPGEDAGRWVVTAYDRESDTAYDGRPVAPITVGADDESIYRIDVLGTTPATESGVRVGTTEDELRSTYPELEGPYDNAISEVWWIEGEDGTLVFETQGPESGLREEGAVDSVILIRVLEPGADPEYGTANSDDVAGGCL